LRDLAAHTHGLGKIPKTEREENHISLLTDLGRRDTNGSHPLYAVTDPSITLIKLSTDTFSFDHTHAYPILVTVVHVRAVTGWAVVHFTPNKKGGGSHSPVARSLRLFDSHTPRSFGGAAQSTHLVLCI
jgi:hypothetical protein